jgi:polysaccharide deacetylase family protein (PEP-CTERM system associated)
VQGFRAPTFSITKDTYWAIDIIAETGFKYDSSIFPIHHDRYGIPDSPRLPYKIGDLWEIPMSTVRFFGANVPFGGGGYFRLYPYWLTNFFIKVAARNGNPFVFYQHPWELDASASTQPKSWVGWLRRNLVWGSTKEKLKKVVAQYEFQTIGDWVKAHENETGKIA